MPWLHVVLASPHPEVERVSAAFSALGAVAVTWQAHADQALYEPAVGTTPLWSETCVMALFDAGTDPLPLHLALTAVLGTQQAASAHYGMLADQDWSQTWRRDFPARRYGDRLWVAPWDESIAIEDAVIVRLDPGLAFGTGAHATTALCLEWLDAQDLAGNIVIDYGCGSGILAIAALKLGAARAYAVDIDPQALHASAENASRNGVADQLIVARPDLPDLLALPRCDVLVANILCNPLIEHAARFAACAKPGISIVLSGILSEQRRAVADAYEPWFSLESTTARDGWLRLVLRRRAINPAPAGSQAAPSMDFLG